MLCFACLVHGLHIELGVSCGGCGILCHLQPTELLFTPIHQLVIFKLSSGQVTHSLAYYAVQIVGLLARAVASQILALPAHPKLSLQF